MRQNQGSTRRSVIRLQSLSCLTLIFLMFFTSFGSLYSVDVKVSHDAQRAIDDVVDILNEVAVEKSEAALPSDDTDTEPQKSADEIEVVLPEKVDVSLFNFIKLLFKLDDVSRILSGVVDLYSSATDSQDYNRMLNSLYSTMSAARSLVTSDEFIDTLALVVTVMHAFSQSSVEGGGMVVMILMTVLLPLALWTLISITLLGTVFTVWNAERWYFWMNKCFKASIFIYAVVLGVMLTSRAISLSWGLLLSLLACVLGFAVAALLTRFKSRTPEGIRYINVLQICSAAKLVGFGIFFLCFAKSNLISRYFTVAFRDLIGNILSQDHGDAFLKQFLFTIMSLAAIIALFAAFSTAMSALMRIGSMQKRNKETSFFSTTMCGVLLLAPLVSASFYPGLTINANVKFVVGAFIGLSIMIFSEVAIPVGRNLFCKGLRESEKDAILRGLETVETELITEEES